MRLSHIPLRLSTGAFILNTGLSKRSLDKESAAGLQAMAAGVIPPVNRLQPETFGKMLSYAEMTLGVALLTPFLPSRVVGAGLGIFSGSLVALYLKTPGMADSPMESAQSAGNRTGKGCLDARNRRSTRA